MSLFYLVGGYYILYIIIYPCVAVFVAVSSCPAQVHPVVAALFSQHCCYNNLHSRSPLQLRSGGRGEGGEEGEGGTADIKSNNPHLTGGKKTTNSLASTHIMSM